MRYQENVFIDIPNIYRSSIIKCLSDVMITSHFIVSDHNVAEGSLHLISLG